LKTPCSESRNRAGQSSRGLVTVPCGTGSCIIEKLSDPFGDILFGECDAFVGTKVFETSEKGDTCAVDFGDFLKINHNLLEPSCLDYFYGCGPEGVDPIPLDSTPEPENRMRFIPLFYFNRRKGHTALHPLVSLAAQDLTPPILLVKPSTVNGVETVFYKVIAM
jgi:hypothetical protein